MNNLVSIVKMIVIIQIILIGCGILVLYLSKLFFELNKIFQKKKVEKIRFLLKKIDDNPEFFNKSMIKFFKQSIEQVLKIIIEPEHAFKNINNVLNLLTENVFKPKARELTFKRYWFKRYLAISCFAYGVDQEDEKCLIYLVNDKTFLVSLNAGRVIFKYPTTKTLNALIDCFSKERYLQQSAFTEIITSEKYDFQKLETTIIERIQKESNPYIKAFCYRILSKIPRSINIISTIERDCDTDNKELKIAMLDYFTPSSDATIKNIIVDFINDSHWEVRAIACKKLGELGDESLISLLVSKLYDPEWWVRINAAEALAKLGANGVSELQNINPEHNKHAYDTAQIILSGLKEK